MKEHFSAKYAEARSLEDRRRWFEPIRAKLGKVSVNELCRSAEDTVSAIATGEKMRHAAFRRDARRIVRITRLGIQQPS